MDTVKVYIIPGYDAKYRKGIFGKYYDIFCSWLKKHGYHRKPMQICIHSIHEFGKYLEKRCSFNSSIRRQIRTGTVNVLQG